MNSFIAVMIPLGIIVFSALIVSGIGWYVNWLFFYKAGKSDQSISFNQFCNLYYICPERWSIASDDCVKYKNTCIYFKSCYDYIKYRLFKKNIIGKFKMEEYSKDRVQLIKSWQADIDEYRKKYQTDLDELKKKIN